MPMLTAAWPARVAFGADATTGSAPRKLIGDDDPFRLMARLSVQTLAFNYSLRHARKRELHSNSPIQAYPQLPAEKPLDGAMRAALPPQESHRWSCPGMRVAPHNKPASVDLLTPLLIDDK
jgi:hypothetical protein